MFCLTNGLIAVIPARQWVPDLEGAECLREVLPFLLQWNVCHKWPNGQAAFIFPRSVTKRSPSAVALCNIGCGVMQRQCSGSYGRKPHRLPCIRDCRISGSGKFRKSPEIQKWANSGKVRKPTNAKVGNVWINLDTRQAESGQIQQIL